MKQLDLLLVKHGRLLPIQESRIGKKRSYVCSCDCGNLKNVAVNHLSQGKTVSCGCNKNEKAALKSMTHSMTGTPTYRSWQHMKDRCLNPKNNRFQIYGARGVSICERWKTSFENFLADMGERPIGKSLDRINPFGNYEPNNCRWATPKEQANNRRKVN